jgi:hypothetical protein
MDRKMHKTVRPPARFQLSRYERIRWIVNRNVTRVLKEIQRTAGAAPAVQRVPVASPVPVDRF